MRSLRKGGTVSTSIYIDNLVAEDVKEAADCRLFYAKTE